jgi:hypothetical protein
MPLQIDTLEGQPDTARLIEDLSATLPLYRSGAAAGRVVQPSTAVLQMLGEGFLDQGPLGTAQVVQRAPGFPAIVDSFLAPVFGGSVRLSYFLMALVLGRPGLRNHFLHHGQFDWTGCLRWLVLHGVREMHLWPYLSDGFVCELRAPSLLVEGKHLSPLQAIVMAERPDVLAAFREQASPEQFAAFFSAWFLRRGAADYEHAWLMSAAEVRAKVRQDPGGAWTGAVAAEASADDAPLAERGGFPDGPVDPSPPASLARAAARATYRHYGTHYPCAFLDLSDANAPLGAIVTGEARAGLRGGVELLSPFIEVRLPDTRRSTVLLRIEIAVPEPLRDDIAVRLRARNALGPVGFVRHFTGRALARGPVTIPLILHDLSERLEISFSIGGRAPAPGREVVTALAILRSLQVWQILDAADATAAPPAATR